VVDCHLSQAEKFRSHFSRRDRGKAIHNQIGVDGITLHTASSPTTSLNTHCLSGNGTQSCLGQRSFSCAWPWNLLAAGQCVSDRSHGKPENMFGSIRLLRTGIGKIRFVLKLNGVLAG
jgi:hypothetical protein